MEIKTITGSSISDALAEARSLWGDDVVMLQASPPSVTGQARIAVGIPAPAAACSDAAALSAAPSGVGSLHREGFSERRDPMTVLLADDARPSGSVGRGESHRLASILFGEPPAATISTAPAPGALRRASSGTGALLPDRIRPVTDVLTRVNRSGEALPPAAVAASAQPAKPDQQPESQETAPLFLHLIRQGVRPRRARELADLAQSHGHQAAETRLASMLPQAFSGRPPSRVLFSGEPGSGKTSLILRSALSRVRAGRRAPTIIVVAPGSRDLRGWQDPTAMFESFDLEVVRCSGEALPSALSAIEGEVLIDLPSGASVPSGTQAHIRLVVDARNTGSATAREGGPAQSAVVTHLDGAPSLGFLAERLIAMAIPVAALVESGRPEGGVQAYTPDHFAALVCHE